MIRKVENKDFEILYKWINDEEVVKFSRYREEKSLEEFIDWFNYASESDNMYMFIMEYDGKKVGQVNFSMEDGECIVTYSVDSSFRGRGYGTELIEFVENLIKATYNGVLILSAFVSTDNVASVKVFEKRGFIREIDEIDYIKLIKKMV